MANELILRKLGKRIREVREQKGITSQMALANKSGLDRSYIGGVERGQRNVSLVNIEKIAKALGVPIDELLRFGTMPTYASEKKVWLLHDK